MWRYGSSSREESPRARRKLRVYWKDWAYRLTGTRRSKYELKFCRQEQKEIAAFREESKVCGEEVYVRSYCRYSCAAHNKSHWSLSPPIHRESRITINISYQTTTRSLVKQSKIAYYTVIATLVGLMFMQLLPARR